MGVLGGEGDNSASCDAPGVFAGRTHKFVDDAPFLYNAVTGRIAGNGTDGSSSGAFVAWGILAGFNMIEDILDMPAYTLGWPMLGSTNGLTCVADRCAPRRALTILSTPPCLRRWYIKAATTSRMIRTTPPTTPPAMAATGLWLDDRSDVVCTDALGRRAPVLVLIVPVLVICALVLEEEDVVVRSSTLMQHAMNEHGSDRNGCLTYVYCAQSNAM